MHLISDVPTGYKTRIEAFVNGYYNTEENLKDPSYVPSYLKMPDYTKLP